jgi:hypothetical protein
MSDLEFNKNEDNMRLMVGELKHKKEVAYLGGGEQSIVKHKASWEINSKRKNSSAFRCR